MARLHRIRAAPALAEARAGVRECRQTQDLPTTSDIAAAVNGCCGVCTRARSTAASAGVAAGVAVDVAPLRIAHFQDQVAELENPGGQGDGDAADNTTDDGVADTGSEAGADASSGGVDGSGAGAAKASDTEGGAAAAAEPKKSKAQKRREKKEREAKERQVLWTCATPAPTMTQSTWGKALLFWIRRHRV